LIETRLAAILDSKKDLMVYDKRKSIEASIDRTLLAAQPQLTLTKHLVYFGPGLIVMLHDLAEGSWGSKEQEEISNKARILYQQAVPIDARRVWFLTRSGPKAHLAHDNRGFDRVLDQMVCIKQ
jgi:hypothetical protein